MVKLTRIKKYSFCYYIYFFKKIIDYKLKIKRIGPCYNTKVMLDIILIIIFYFEIY